jgi:UDP-N-acetylglucosamine--N-acetylmuramyl-(pentapeptide) pyrophosphoryl-undecaprenol N-acetylglucosamine transferase
MYPALAVLQALESEVDPGSDLSILWVGGTSGMEVDLLTRAGVPFEAIPAAGVHGVGLRALPGNLVRLGRGYLKAGDILRRFQPDVLFFTGGYVAVPVALAGRRVPSLLFVPDIEPGLALKTLARFADRIALTVEDSRQFFPWGADLAVTGYPTRPELRKWDKPKAFQLFDLEQEIPVLLVVGGSLGARSINRALISILPEILTEMQVIHVSGRLDWEEVSSARDRLTENNVLSTSITKRYHAYPYLHDEMGAALAAADLVVARSGASALGEFPLFGLPAILVPYPFAWRYQRVNAEFLTRHSAAVIIPDQDLQTRLLPEVRDLMRDPLKRMRMHAAMSALALPQAASTIARILIVLAEQENRRRKKQ